MSYTSEEKTRQEQVEERPVATARPGFVQKTKRHCARFWWVHLIIFCVIFLIVALCLVYVGLPRIAQHDVDKAKLTFTELQFLEPTPNSLVLTQKSSLENPSLFTPTLDAFNASFYVVTNGVAGADSITQIQLPSIHARKPASEVTLENQQLVIDNLDQLNEFCHQVLVNEYIETELQGKTKLHLGALPVTNIEYTARTKYKGLNGLKGFNVTDAKVDFLAEPGTPNLSGKAFIPNPSVMTVAMGNVTLELSTAGAGVIGNSTILNMVIRPGDNSLDMIATIDQGLLIGSLVDGKVDMIITGKEAVYNGQHLTYYEKALASNVLTLNMNVQQILADSA